MRRKEVQLVLPLLEANSQTRAGGVSCIYCGNSANTRDHAPPRGILEQPLPSNLRTVPACQTCNAGWSKDEEYLAVILAQIGERPHLMAKLEPGGKVDRALSKSPGLDETITKALSVVGERVYLTPDFKRIDPILRKIAYGLYVLRYGRGAKFDGFSVCSISGPGEEIPGHLVAAQWNWPGQRRKRWTVVQEGVFSFMFARGWMVHEPSLYCLLDMHETIFSAVSCPPPSGRRSTARLRSKPW